MKFKVKDLDIATGGLAVVVLQESDLAKLDLCAGDRVLLRKGKKHATAIVDVAESSKSFKEGWIGCFEEVLDKLHVKEGGRVEVSFARKPDAVHYIRMKLDGKKLNYSEYDSIVSSIVKDELSEGELTYFVSACYARELPPAEIAYLTKSIVKHSDRLKNGKKMVLDKHCSGGVPGNRTTMLVVPIIVAAGFFMPKTSSRSITSPAGTADTMEVLSKVIFSADKIKKIVRKTRGCIVWGGGMNIAAADDKLIRIRNPLSIDPEGMLIASILAKKLAVGATHVLIDLPVGKDTKIQTVAHAKKYKRLFRKVGRQIGLKIYVVITNGEEPIGRGIGPLLEARDVLYILKRDERRPHDLEKKSLFLAGKLLKIAGVRNGFKKAKEVLENGKAYKKMKDIIKAQGGNPNIDPDNLKPGQFFCDVPANKAGKIIDINTQKIARLARIAGAPVNKSAGIDLYKHENERVRKGELLFTIYAKNKEKLEFAKDVYKKYGAVTIR